MNFNYNLSVNNFKKFGFLKLVRIKFVKTIMGVKQSCGSKCVKELSVEEMELLKKSTHLNHEQILDYYKNFIEDCPDGRLTKKIFNNMFSTLQPALKNADKGDKYCEYVFK